MNILFINKPNIALFTNLHSGGSHRSTGFVYALAQIGHVDIIDFSGTCKATIIEENCSVVYSKEMYGGMEEPTRYPRLQKILRLFNWFSFDRIFPKNEKAEHIVDQFVNAKEYDYIACRYIHCASHYGLLKYSNRLIIDIDDNPRNTFIYRAKIANSIRNKLYHLLYSLTIDICTRHVLKNVFCSFYSNIYQKPEKSSIFLHNVSLNRFEIENINDSTPKRILFISSLNYLPNWYGISWFINQVFPQIKSTIPEIELCIVGDYSSHKDTIYEWKKNCRNKNTWVCR